MFLYFVRTHRSTVSEDMSKDQIEKEYIHCFFNYHISNNTPPHGLLDVESVPTYTSAHDKQATDRLGLGHNHRSLR